MHPTALEREGDVLEILAAFQRTCARLADGRVVCWGEKVEDQKASTVPVVVEGIESPVELLSGGISSCARESSGETVCWGGNYTGQLGDGVPDEEPAFVEVLGLASRRCGDGALLTGETCDDRNTDNAS